MSKDTKLVYSTDPATQAKIEAEARHNFVAVLRIEKQGRQGKTVTVIDQLPKQEIFLRELTTKLKKKCGSGGTYSLEGKEGVIEIQGDKREMIRKIFAADGIKLKG